MRKLKRNYKSEILEIIETKDWDRAKKSNDENLYSYVRRHKDTDENCRIISEHIGPRDVKSEILDIIETEDWSKAKKSNDRNLYLHIYRHKDTDKNCKTIWEHIKTEREHHSIKRYLLYYFKHGKPTPSSLQYYWFLNQIKQNDKPCIDIKNLIVAAENFQDPVALETLDLIKNHLEKEDT
jgi:hypothetical protein